MARRNTTGILIAIVLLAGSAQARDFCFNSTSPPNPAPPTNPDILVIAKKFTMPRRGDCRPIVGYDVGQTEMTFTRPASGTACLDSAGTTLHVGIMLHAVDGPAPLGTDAPVNVHMKVPYPALSGGDVYIRRDSPFYSVQRQDGAVGPCGLALPIP